MTPNEIDRMLVEHIADMEDGAKRLDKLQERVAEAMDTIVRQWADDNGWVADEKTWYEDELTVGPPHWRTPDGEWLARFSLWYSAAARNSDFGAEQFWLACLCNESTKTFGFRFYQDQFNNGPWKKFIRTRSDTMQETRFMFDDEASFFLPVRVDKGQLAVAVGEESIEDGLIPITEALDYLRNNWHAFEKIRLDMAAQQGDA